MLKAVIHGKAGRVEVNGKEEDISWRQLFKSREDLLTAAIFTRWSYLSSDTQHKLMCNWFEVPVDGEHDFTTFHNIEFWPKYDLTEVNDRQYVEPDVLIQFDEFNLLVEVKPPKGGEQYLEQWQNEIAGYCAWEENEDKPLYFLAIGRIEAAQTDSWRKSIMAVGNPHRPELLNGIKWKPVAASIFNLHKAEPIREQDRRILDDMLKALELYGEIGHDYLWTDFVITKHPLPAISLETLSLFDFESPEENIITGTPSQSYAFADLVKGHKHINMEIMKQWPN